MKIKNNLFLELNKKSFTLLETLISVSILVLIFTFIYSQFNLAQLSTKKTTKIEKEFLEREKIIELIYNDFITSKDIEPTSGRKYDKFVNSFTSNNSLYGISKPQLKYAVVRGEDTNVLVRIESHTSNFLLNESNNNFYLDKVANDVEYFKVIKNDEFIELFLKIKNMKDIYFKINRIVK